MGCLLVSVDRFTAGVTGVVLELEFIVIGQGPISGPVFCIYRGQPAVKDHWGSRSVWIHGSWSHTRMGQELGFTEVGLEAGAMRARLAIGKSHGNLGVTEISL